MTTTVFPPAAPPEETILLHCLTAWEAQQTLPQQKQLPPHPSQAQTWQHSGSMALSPSGLQSQ